jgi:hypothetical protein
MLWFIWRLEKTQKLYSQVFRGNSIEMQDFTVRVQNMPIDSEYENNPDVLQAYLTKHFEKVIRNQILDEFDEEMLKKVDPAILEVADVTFGDPEVKNSIQFLSRMQDLRSKYLKNMKLQEIMELNQSE